MTDISQRQVQPAIVVVAHNRPHSLRRLLRSIEQSKFDRRVDLVISIDKSDNREVEQVAAVFPWPHGSKRVQVMSEHLGLKQHVLRCGDLTAEFGSIIMLEDDLFVSPHFHQYTCQALGFYGSDSDIAGIALYSQRYNETAELGFRALDDETDVFFAQLPCSWGQCWTDVQWQTFRSWLSDNPDDPDSPDLRVPQNVLEWPAASWKKQFFRYVVATNKYFVYPRISLSTNFADTGVHHKPGHRFLQTPLLVRPKAFRFQAQTQSLAVYDAHMEILPERLEQLATQLRGGEFCVDFYGTKPIQILDRPRVLTARDCSECETTYGRELKPIELNICYEIEGQDIALTQVASCNFESKQRARQDVAYFHDLSTRLVRGPKWSKRASDLLRSLPTYRGKRAA